MLIENDAAKGYSIKKMDKEGKTETLSLDLPLLKESHNFSGFAADSESICIISGSSVYHSKKLAPFYKAASLPVSSVTLWSEAFMLKNGAFAVNADGIHKRTLGSAEGFDGKLNVISTMALSDVSVFRRLYPNVDISIETNYDSVEDVYKKILSGDSSVDIYTCFLNYGFVKLMQKGYTAPISSCILKEEIQKMYPQIAKALVNEKGELLAWPSELFVERPSISINLWKLVYGDRPYPKSFDELLDSIYLWESSLAEKWSDIEFLLNFDHAYLASWLIDGYIQSAITNGINVKLNNEKLKSLLIKLEEIVALRKARGANIAFMSEEDYHWKPLIFLAGLIQRFSMPQTESLSQTGKNMPTM